MTLSEKYLNKDDYAAAVIQELTSLGQVMSKKMFGGIGLFLDGVMFAKVSGDSVLYFRVDDSNRADYEQFGTEQFDSENKKKGMPYYQVPAPIIEDEDQFIDWAQTAHKVAVANKKK